MANTAKYVLKSDRSKTVDVIAPIFSVATIVGSDGKKTEMHRDEFMKLYEPALPKTSLADPGSRTASPNNGPSDEMFEKILGYLTSLGGAVDDIARKVDEIHRVAVVPRENNSAG